jgi:RND superfamily putative drug exporter
VTAIRAASPLPGGVTLGVAGTTSAAIDISQKLADALPVYLAVVLGLSLLIMVVVFRSLLVPLVATGGFALSLFAALGGTVAIFQWGWLGGVFGVSDPGPILNFLPTMLAGILFGLAMDYTLFLASGMREAYAHGAPARTAVVLGFKAGRAVVTAAAIIMVSVFGGFVFSESAMIRPIGFALAFGVLVDAFVVRMVILPGVMHLLGDRAWWLPRWLDRLIPNVDVEGASLERKHPHVAGEQPNDPHGKPSLRRLGESPA